MEQQNKTLDELKIELDSKYEANQKLLSDMVEYAKNNGLSEIHDGFKVDVRIGSRFGNRSEIIFVVYDNNYIEGKKSYPKYFWSNESRMTLSIDKKDDSVEIDLDFSTGGMNSHEYGDKENPKLDGVLMAEILINHQLALLKLAKCLKSEPSVIIDYVKKQKEAEREYYEASSNYENEKRTLNNIIFESNKAFIESKIKVAGVEKANSVINSLVNDAINPTQKIVIFEFNKNEFSLHAITIECIRGAKTTFRKIIRDDVGIKKSDALDYISNAVVDNDGNLITSIEEFVKFINDNNISESYNKTTNSVKKYSLYLNTEDVKNAISNGEISKFLTTNNEKLNNENKKSLKIK